MIHKKNNIEDIKSVFSIEYIEPLSAYELFLLHQISIRSGKKGLKVIRNDNRKKGNKLPFSKQIGIKQLSKFLLLNEATTAPFKMT